MTELGTYAMVFALCTAVYALVVIPIGLKRRDMRFIVSGYRGLYLTFFFYTVAAGVLIQLFLTDGFHVGYVAGYSERALPVFYKITGLWAGQAGSLLFWGWLLAFFGALVVYQNRKDTLHLYLPYVAVTMAVTEIFFVFISIFVTSPFELLTRTPMDGSGLNPLLQNPGMVFHPPALYLGFVGFTVPFAFAVSAMITGRLDSWWIRKTRNWTVVSWAFLTLGIVFGGWWAYMELGWGGVWAWDPVENASLMPWLTASAFLHSVMIQERRNMLRVWNMVLIMLTFALSIFGTFLTRSGVVSSVHAFGQSAVGYAFLGFVVVILIVGISLIVVRYQDLRRQDHRLEALLSRESTFLYNNLVFLGLAFATFWGTIFPIISEAVRNVKISVGPPFFNKINAPLFLTLIVLMGICPLVGWRSTSWRNFRRNFTLPTAVMVLSLPLIHFLGGRGALPVAFFAFTVFATVNIATEFWKGTRARQGMTGEGPMTALSRLVWRNRQRYGGYIIHLGVVMMAVGLVGYSFFQTKEEVRMMPGTKQVVGDYSIEYEKLEQLMIKNYRTVTARIDVYRDGRWVDSLAPEKRFYKNQRQPTTEVAISSNHIEDLYLILAGYGSNGGITLIVIVNPLLSWVWWGTLLAMAGSLLAVIPKRRPRPATVSVPAPGEAARS